MADLMSINIGTLINRKKLMFLVKQHTTYIKFDCTVQGGDVGNVHIHGDFLHTATLSILALIMVCKVIF